MPRVDAPINAIRAHVRWMIRRDMPAVMDIERASFEHPWDEETFLSHLRQRNVIGMVAEYGELIVGHMVYELHKNRIYITDFATHPDARRRGVGRQMVHKLLGKLSELRRTAITLHVRETNLAAQHFFAAQGFRATGVCREHYEDTGEDAYAMEYRLRREPSLAFGSEPIGSGRDVRPWGTTGEDD